MADTLLRSPSSRHAGAFRTRKTSNEPSQKADSYHCHQLSKLVTGALGLTARSNPNWRTRPNSDDSQATNNGRQSKVRAKRNKTMASSSNLEPKSQHAPDHHFVLHPNVDTRSRALPGTRDMEIPEYSEDEGRYYQVYRHIDLGPFGFAGAPLTLLEFGHKCDGNPQSLIKVRRFPTKLDPRSKTSDNIQKEQLKAALRAGATTPHKTQSANESNLSPNTPSVPAAAPDVQKIATNMPDFDMAFQKMLQKLTRSVEQDQKDDINVKTEKNQIPKPSYPMPNIGRIINTVSDPCDGVMFSQTHPHKKEDSNDSGVCVEENCKSVLNPRAREFLTKQELMSFRNKECPPILPGSANEFNRSTTTQCPRGCRLHGRTPVAPASPMAGKPITTETVPPCQPVAKTTACRQSPSPVMSNAQPVMTYGFAPFLLNNFLSSGSLLPLNADQTPRQCLGPASAALTALPALTTQPVLQPIAGTLSGFPSTPLLNSVFPTMPGGHIDPCLVTPACPLPVVGPATRPPPVPKPRRPDPKDQQAYEAWIEWRKASEPGYALECKLRQQRRAQRNMANKNNKADEKTKAPRSA